MCFFGRVLDSAKSNSLVRRRILSSLSLSIVFALAACSSDDSNEDVQGDGGAEAMSCADFPVDNFVCDEQSACLGMTAYLMEKTSDAYIKTETTKVECRELGSDCSDADAESYWCDEDGSVWWSSSNCGPEGLEPCPDGVAP